MCVCVGGGAHNLKLISISMPPLTLSNLLMRDPSTWSNTKWLPFRTKLQIQQIAKIRHSHILPSSGRIADHRPGQSVSRTLSEHSYVNYTNEKWHFNLIVLVFYYSYRTFLAFGTRTKCQNHLKRPSTKSEPSEKMWMLDIRIEGLYRTDFGWAQTGTVGVTVCKNVWMKSILESLATVHLPNTAKTWMKATFKNQCGVKFTCTTMN